jgi:hypothetical protein
MTSDSAMATIGANLATIAAGEKALRALAAHDIKAAPIKGAWLIERGLRELGAWPLADIDLLVAEEDRRSAHRAMLSAGFHRDHTRPGRPYTDRTHEEFSYSIPIGQQPCTIELHFRLAPRGWLRITAQQLLARAKPGQFGQVPCHLLDELDAVCIVLEHFSHHGLTLGKQQFADLVALRRKGLLDDISAVLGRCQAWGCLTGAWTALQIMNGVWPADAVVLPAAFAPSALTRAFLARVIKTDSFPASAMDLASMRGRFVWRWFLMDNFLARVWLFLDPAYRLLRDLGARLWP